MPTLQPQPRAGASNSGTARLGASDSSVNNEATDFKVSASSAPAPAKPATPARTTVPRWP